MSDAPDPKGQPRQSKILSTLATIIAVIFGIIIGYMAYGYFLGAADVAPEEPVDSEVRLGIPQEEGISALTSESEPAATGEATAESDETLKSKLKGIWTQQKDVKQTLVLEEDGTGTLTVEVDSLIAAVLGNKVVMRIQWTVEKGRAVFTSLSGEPEMAFNYIKENYGTKRDRKIDSLDDNTLVLLDDQGQGR